MPICWWLFFDAFFVQRNQSNFLQTRGFLNPRWTLKKQDNMSHTSYDLSQHFEPERSNEMGQVTHVTLYKKSKLTCVTCTILLKDIQKHSVKWGVTCRVTRLTWRFSHVRVFWRKKHLELRITQIFESGFSLSQASYCILLLVKL